MLSSEENMASIKDELIEELTMTAKNMLMKTVRDFLNEVVQPIVTDACEVTRDAARNTFYGMVAGTMSLSEWAALASQSADQIKQRAISKDGLHFVGGKLKFALSEKSTSFVTISFALYFLDTNQKWQMASTAIDASARNFEAETLEELRSQGEISFELE